MLRDIPIKLLLIIGLFISGIIPLLTMSLMSYDVSVEELTGQSFKQLESVRKIKEGQLKRFFDQSVAHLKVLAKNPYLIGAMSDLNGYMVDKNWNAELKGETKEVFQSAPAFKRKHDKYFSYFKEYIDQYQLYDLFFISPQNGICYFTVKKESDFGKPVNIVHSSLSEVWRKVIKSKNIAVSDTLLYAPSSNRPAQFIAAPVIKNGVILGVLAVQISIDTIDSIMSERSGMGRSGETYLVGGDYKMRSDSFLDPIGHSVDASLKGTIEENGVLTKASIAALRGEEGVAKIIDYNGNRVLTSYGPLKMYGLNWAIIAEIDESEINELIKSALNHKVIAIIGIAITLLFVLAFSISHFISSGVKNVIRELERIVDSVLHGNLTSRVAPDLIPVDSAELVSKVNLLIDSFVYQIDEKCKLEQAIQYNQRLESIGTLAGGIAHDFNNILTYMYTYADLVRDDLEDGDHNCSHMDEVLKAIDRASALVRQIMTFSRDVKKEKSPIQISIIIKEALKLISASIPKNITVKKSISDSDLYVFSDSTQINQIIMNLCTNAFHALLECGGVIEVKLSRVNLTDQNKLEMEEGEYALLEVSDTGIGIEKKFHDRIFDPFFTTKPEGLGTGMGLAVIHGIVTQLKGKICFESEKGRGTFFHIYLPITPPPTEDISSQLTNTLNCSGLNILFVDDEESICKSSKEMLEGLGCSVKTFSSPVDAAIEIFSRPELYDVLVTDFSMPEMNGVELCLKVRKSNPSIPIVMTTGYAEQIDIYELKTLNVEDLVHKPYSKHDLIKRLNGIFCV